MSLEENQEPGAGAAAAPPELRRLTDARTLRALAHPVRIALVEMLSVEGPMTATEVGELIGESPTTCSFHLRQLARYGFVEEAGGGKGRARPWRMTSVGFSFARTHDDPEAEIAASALNRVLLEHQLGRHEEWQAKNASYPREWREAAEDNEWASYLTAEELKQLNQDLIALLQSRFPERLSDPSQRPPGAALVEMLLLSYPVSLPGRSLAGRTDDPAGPGGRR
jgi:DNA-binding transcriptional ArsR family regulator